MKSLDLECDFFGVLVLPDADDSPPVGPQSNVHEPVSSRVAKKLALPVLRVRSRLTAVLGTAVPKAAINEYG